MSSEEEISEGWSFDRSGRCTVTETSCIENAKKPGLRHCQGRQVEGLERWGPRLPLPPTSQLLLSRNVTGSVKLLTFADTGVAVERGLADRFRSLWRRGGFRLLAQARWITDRKGTQCI